MKTLFLFLLFLLFSSTASAVDFPVTSNFGWRYHPINGNYSFHAGVDLGYDYGTPILALFDGVVVQSGNYGDGYGNQVLLYHSDTDTYTRYCHCSEVFVTLGQPVFFGNVIALVGSTGYSTGPHLHLELIVPDGAGGYAYADPLLLWSY